MISDSLLVFGENIQLYDVLDLYSSSWNLLTVRVPAHDSGVVFSQCRNFYLEPETFSRLRYFYRIHTTGT